MGMMNKLNGSMNPGVMQNQGQQSGGIMNQNQGQQASSNVGDGAQWQGDGQQQTQGQNQGQGQAQGQGGNNTPQGAPVVVNDFNKAWLVGHMSDKPNTVKTSIVPKEVMEEYWKLNANAAIKALPSKMLKYIKADGKEDNTKPLVQVSAEKFNAVSFRALFTDEYLRLRNEVGYFQPIQNEAKTRFYVVKYVPDKDEKDALAAAKIEHDLHRFAVHYNKQKHIAVMTLKNFYKYMGACRTQKMYIAGKSINGSTSKAPNEKDSAGMLIVHTYEKVNSNNEKSTAAVLLIYYKAADGTLDSATTLAQIKSLPHIYLHDIRDVAAKNNKNKPCPLFTKTGEYEVEEPVMKDGKPTGDVKKVKKNGVQNVYSTDKFLAIFPEVDLTQLRTAVPTPEGASVADKKALREKSLVKYETFQAELTRMGIDSDDFEKIIHPVSKGGGNGRTFDLVAVSNQRELTMSILGAYASQATGTWDDAVKTGTNGTFN